jgi:probable F420-dependent oxidoreductase
MAGDCLKVDAEVAMVGPAEVAELARKAETYGFDCFWVNETKHDPFVQLALAAHSTKGIGLGTSIALAFTRSPTTLAYTAWDLQSISKGRLILGLGSQVKGHIERRFGMKWEAPAPKMKEVVSAIRSVWKCWQEGTELDFEGRFFRLDLMTPFFSPGPIEHPVIPLYIAGVNAGMCRVAGAVADGLHVHPLHTVRYIREVIEPALAEGARRAGRRREEVAVAVSVFAALGETRAEVESIREVYREQISFYASTRSYRKVLELHGWGDVCDRLHSLSAKGEWRRMASEVGDDMLREFVVEGSWGEIGGILEKRYGGLADRVRMYLPFDGDEKWKSLVGGFRA